MEISAGLLAHEAWGTLLLFIMSVYRLYTLPHSNSAVYFLVTALFSFHNIHFHV